MKVDTTKLRDILEQPELNYPKVREVVVQIIKLMDENKFNGIERRFLIAMMEDILFSHNTQLLIEKLK